MKKIFTTSLAFLLLAIPIFISMEASSIQIYFEIRIYRINQPAQSEVTEKFLKDTFIPAMHRAGINTIGVFKSCKENHDVQ